MSNFKFPPIGYYFKVILEKPASTSGNSSGDKSPSEIFCQEVSGLEVEKEVVEIMEGGINEYKHRLPGRTQYKNLVLKRGLVYEDKEILDWVKDCIQSNLNSKIEPRTITVQLLKENEANKILMTWSVERAYPIKWNVSNLNAQQNAIVIESIEFAFQKFSVLV